MNGAADSAQGWHTPVPEAHPAAALLSAAAVRRHCGEVFAQVAAGNSAHFIWHGERLPEAARGVAALTRERYPHLNIPYHSRWRHFSAGGIDRWAMLARRYRLEGDEAVRSMIDLTITSALLDAGAGNSWRYADREFGATLGRSEGLAAASIALFAAGVLSDRGDQPLRADAAALMRVREGHIVKFFQVDHIANPLTGVEGRAQLMRNLGVVAAATPAVFGQPARIGNLFDYLLGHSTNHTLPATFILDTLLRALAPLWPDREVLDGVPLGDCWRHPAATGGRVPFHKLTQWLTYSLLDPLEVAGIAVTGLDELTGLPEYRN
ncbi:MAG TPA: DUF1688 family protein, partial [Usitatibacteraceae bacterium]|nr:DUF1688 family protein [Usitatibacteraceae bacterium]